MEDTFTINLNGEMKEATAIINFTFNQNTYCIYAISKNDEDVDIYCGKIIDKALYDIEDEKEKEIVNQIVEELLDDNSFEMRDEKKSTIIVEYNGVPTTADVLDIININNEKYLILAITQDEKTSDIFIRKIVTENGKETFIPVEEEEEKENVFDIIRNIVNQEG